MTFSQLHENYLTKLELNKPYKLGSIYARLVQLNVECDMVVLYLQLYASEYFETKIVACSWESIEIKRIK